VSVATASLIALIIAILVSCFSPLNVGLLSMGFTYLVGNFMGKVPVKTIIAGFPVSLVVMLIGVSYLFATASVNGTLEKLSKFFVKGVRGRAALLPMVYFVLAFVLSSIGPGAIPITALLAPPALAAASQTGIPVFLMAIMVVHGGIAGAMSPIAATGVVANKIIAEIGLPDVSGKVYSSAIISNLVICAAAYVLFGGLKLLRENRTLEASDMEVEKFTPHQTATLIGILLFAVSVIWLKFDVGLTALTIGVALSIMNPKEEATAIKKISWGTIVMVGGVTMLINLMGQVGGLDMLTTGIANVSSPGTIALTFSFIAGLISVYASSTGVVLPAFLPLVPGIIEKLGGGNAIAVVLCACVGTLVVDSSPLSTLGALALNAAPEKENKQKLFRDLMAWGLSMAVVGAVVSWFFFSVLGLA
jgi:di/tricarboxylate transporter